MTGQLDIYAVLGPGRCEHVETATLGGVTRCQADATLEVVRWAWPTATGATWRMCHTHADELARTQVATALHHDDLSATAMRKL